MYTRGLDLREVGGFSDHGGFDGVMLEEPGKNFHFEFTHCRTHPMTPSPTPEDLLVFYVPSADDWSARCRAMLDAGFVEVESFNVYWSRHGRTFQDADGYRVVIQQASWGESEVGNST
jgi:hypothetical protein